MFSKSYLFSVNKPIFSIILWELWFYLSYTNSSTNLNASDSLWSCRLVQYSRFFPALLTTEVIKEELTPGSLSPSYICDPDFLSSFSITETPSKLAGLKCFMIVISGHSIPLPKKGNCYREKQFWNNLWKLFELEIRILSTFLSC